MNFKLPLEKKLITVLLLFFFSAFIVTKSEAQTTYYVNDASLVGDVITSAVGDDLNSGTSTSSPYATISKAMTMATSGDIIYVDAGTYTQAGFTIKAGVKLSGMCPSKSIIVVQTSPIVVSSNAELTRFTIKRTDGSDVPSIAVSTITSGTGMKINNCLFVKCRSAIYVNGTTAANALTVSNNDFDDNRTGLVLADANYANITISNNNLVDSRSFGIIFTGANSLSNISIDNNNFTGNLAGGLAVEGTAASGITLNNNWFGTATPATYSGVVNGGFSVDAHNVVSSYPYNFTDANGPTLPNYPNDIGGVAVAAISSAVHASAPITYTTPSCGVTSNNPVATYFTIQAAVDGSNAGATISIPPGVYAENVTVNKSLTIVGTDSSNTILDKGDGNYSALGGNGFTITADNVSISKLKIRNYTSGISNTVGVSNLSISEVSLLENFNAGFYSNQSLNGLSITNSIIKNNGYKNNVHSSGIRRGIMLQSSAADYVNLVITGNTVTDNSLVGIDINLNKSTDGITISNNTLARNGDDEIGVWLGNNNSATSGAVLIDNNNITLSNAVRFGIEVKNPDGTGATSGVGSIVVSNNTINTVSHIGVSRDMGGIVVIRRKDNYAPPLINNDQPKGVVILNNTINVENAHINTDDAYGIVVGGTNHLIKDNTITNTEVSIQLQKGNHNYDNNNNSEQNNVDFYFSRDNSADVCAYLDNNTIIGSGLPRLVTGVATASATLPNNVYNTSTQMAFCTIQDAIDNDFTVDGNIINVGAGIFTEEILLNKNLSLRGANYGINPNTGSRVAETILHPSTSGADPNDVSAVVMIYVEPTGSGSTIDGFTIDGNNPLLTSGILINEGTTDVDAIEAISAYEGLSNFTATNNIIKNFSYAGMDLYNYYNSGAATTDNVVSNNLFEGIRPTGGYGIGVLIYNNCYTNITNNVMNGVNVGIQTGNFYNADPGNSHSIANNAIESVNRGIWHNMPYSNAATFSISDNTISTHSSATANRGIMISTVQGTATATVTNNTITGAKYGYYLWSNPTSNNITITGGSVNSTNGIVADNFLGYNTNATSSSYIIDGVNITAVDTGIIVRDDVANTNNATVAVTIKGNTTVSNANIGLAIIGSDASASVVTTDPDVVTLSGDIVNTSGTPLNASTGDIALNGTTSNIEGGATIRNLTLNNTTGATIASGVGNTVNILNTYTPTAGVLTTNNNLVLKSTASTTASIAQGNAAGNYIDGSVVVERFVPAKAARKWNFLASPITQSIADGWQQQIHITGAGTGGTVCPTLTPHTNGYDATVSNAPNIYTYDAANASGTRWTKPATTNADFLTAGKAFRVNVRGDRNLGCSLLDGSPSGLVPTAVTLSSTGAINNTNKNAGNFTITFNNAKDDNSTDKYVMIGNPYPSMLSFSALQAANNTTIATNYAIYIPANPASIYSYWDAMTSSFTGGIGYDNSFGDVIASGQSFFVQSLLVNDNFMSLDFAENQKSTTMFNGYFKPRSFNEQIKVNYIQNNKKVDEVIIRYANDAGISNTEVGNMDIPSMNSGTFISSLKESKRMVIQTRDLQTLNNDEVWLNVGATESGFYQLNFSDYENFAGTDIFLIDHYTNATQNIRQNATYSFLIDKDNAATKGSERFSIVFNRTVQEVYVQNLIKMYPNPANKQVTIELPQENNISYTIKITDVAGKVVMQHRTNGGTQQLSIGELMTGIYFVEIIDSKGNRKTEKLIKN